MSVDERLSVINEGLKSSKDHERRSKELDAQIKALPDEMQRAIIWIIKNINIVDELAQGEPMKESDIEKFSKKALETNDYVMLLLVEYKKVSDEAKAQSNQQRD